MADSDWELSQAPMDGPEIVVTANTPGRLQGAWKDVSQATSDDPNEIAQGGVQTVADPNLKGVNAVANSLVRRGADYDTVANYLNKRGAPFQEAQLRQVIDYQAKHPEFNGSYFDLETKQVQMNPIQSAFNDLATNPSTSGVVAAPVAAANAETFGQLGKLSKDGAQAGIEQLAQQNPGATALGTLAGGVAQAEGAGELLGLAGVPLRLGEVAQLPVRQVAADVAVGAGQGAAEDPEHPVEGALKMALTNVIAGRAMGALSHGEAPTPDLISDNVNPHLSDEGNAQLQESLRQGDRITAEQVLSSEGQPVNEQTRAAIGHAIDYYKDGGTEDMAFANNRREVTPQEQARIDANDAYENAKDTLTRAQEQKLPADQLMVLNKNVDDAYTNLINLHEGHNLTSPMDTPVPENPLAPEPTPAPVEAPTGENQQPLGDNQPEVQAAISNHQPNFDTPEYQKLAADFGQQMKTHAIEDPDGRFTWYTGPAKNLANYMADAFRGHSYGPIAGAVAKSLQKMEDIGLRNDWEILKHNDVGGGARGYAGEHPRGPGGMISIREDSTTPETTLHELLHQTVTRISHAVDFINAKGTDAQKAQFAKETTALKGLREVNRVVNKYLRDNIDNPEVEALAGKLDNTNFLQNEQELMAWGMTNPRAQKLLASIPMGKSTALSKFVWGIQRLLGLSGADSQNALVHLMTHTGDLLEGESGAAYKTADSLGTRPRLTQAQDSTTGGDVPSEPTPSGAGAELPHDEQPLSPENPPHPDAVQAATDRVTEQLENAVKERNESQGLLDEARKARLAELDRAIASSTDQASADRYAAAKAALSGKTERPNYGSIRDELDPKDVETLGSNIWNTNALLPAEKFRAFGAFQKLLDGEHLLPSELLTLNKVFPTKLLRGFVKNNEDLRTGRYGKQREMFSDAETLSTAPLNPDTVLSKPEADPDEMVKTKTGWIRRGDMFVNDKNQGDLFPETRQQKPFAPGARRGKPEPEPTKPPEDPGLLAAMNNVLRGVMASSDMSGLFNQGAVMAGRKSFWSSIVPGFKSFGSKNYYDAAMDTIKNDSFYNEAKDSGLFMAHLDTDPNAHEEAFMAKLGNIPAFGKLYRAGERGYNGLLNKIRFDGLKNVVENYRAAGVDVTPEDVKALSKFINSATGRGDIGFLKGGGQLASTLLFAPRYLKSRVDLLNPFWYYKLSQESPLAAKYAAGTMVRYFAGVTTILGIAQAAGAQVEWDPRSTDFAKIKVGNIRFSPLGAFQPLMRLTARVAPALVGLPAYKKDSTGKLVPLDGKGFDGTPLEETGNFIRSKLGPVPGLLADRMAGKTITGDDFSWSSAIGQRLVPLWIQDAYSGYQDSGIKGAAATGTASFLGVPTQTYEPHSPKAKGHSNWTTTNTPQQTAPAAAPSSDWDLSSAPTQSGDWSLSNQ